MRPHALQIKSVCYASFYKFPLPFSRAIFGPKCQAVVFLQKMLNIRPDDQGLNFDSTTYDFVTLGKTLTMQDT